MITPLHRPWPSHLRLIALLGICWMGFLTQACTTTSPRTTTSIESKPLTSPSPQSDVEKQLLATIDHAERLGKGNPLVLSSLYSLATYYRSQRQYEKAELQYQKALELKEELSGPNHPDIVTILENYAALLREAQRYTEAENLDSRAAAILAKSSSPSSSLSHSN